MSDFAGKLEVHRPSVGDKARATRKQLLARWGSFESADRLTITIATIGGRELWRHVGIGSGDIFEQQVRT